MDTLAIVSAGSHVAGILKNLLDISQSAGKAEIVSKVIDLQSAFMDLQIKQQELIDERNKLKDENRELNQKLKIEQALEFHYDAYWIRHDDGRLDGPFSQKKWDEDKILSRMRIRTRGRYLISNTMECFIFIYEHFINKVKKEETVGVPIDFIEEKNMVCKEEWYLLFPN